MISTTFTNAPAGFLGLGSADVRPYPGVVVCATPAPVQGTGLPVAAVAVDVRGMTGGTSARLRQVNRQAFGQTATHEQIDPIFTTQNDGTTLGIPSSRRLTS
jgi:hypothetical protein